jgi:hypothetical protein
MIAHARVPRGDSHWSRRRPDRIARGERHGMAKLCEAAVADLRLSYAAGGVTQRALAAAHGVSVATINHALAGKTWRA